MLALLVVAAVAIGLSSVGSASAATIFKQVGEVSGPEAGSPFARLFSESVAVDGKNGHIYVADSGRHRIYDFSSASDATPTVWDGSSTPPGEFQGFLAVAADNSTGAVYVADSAAKVIDKFDQNGNLIASFGDTTPAPNGQLAGLDTPAGSFAPPTVEAGFGIAVDQATGNLYAIDAHHEVIDVFDSTGKYLEQITEKPAGLYGFGAEYADGLAINNKSGELLVSDSAGPAVFRFELGGSFIEAIEGELLGRGYTTVAADNVSGRFYVSTSSETVAVFAAGGTYTGSQISGVGQRPRGIAVDQESANVYVANESPGVIRIFEPLGVPDVETLPPTALSQTSAVLHGHVDPAGNGPITDCHFVVSGGIGSVPCDQPAPVVAPAAVTATVSGLQSNTNYTYRLVAANAKGANEGASEPIRTLGPPLIESLSALDVSATAATLEATIDPEGFATTYHFDYVTEADWLADGEAFGAGTTSVPVPDQPIGAGNSGIALTATLNSLVPSTAYRYRVVAVSTQGSSSSESVLITQAATNPLLPDGRGYELVSPVDKRGSLISPLASEGLTQSAADGTALTYLANGPFEPQPESNSRSPQIFSIRSSGWSSKQIALPHQVPTGAAAGGGQDVRFFSADLSHSLVEPAVSGPFPAPGSFASLSPDATEQTPYIRENSMSSGSFCSPRSEACYRPLVTAAPGLANVPAGTVFGEVGSLAFLGATDDLTHVILRSGVALTPTPLTGGNGLYEWSAEALPSEQLQLISMLPDETAASGGSYLGRGTSGNFKSVRGAISQSGERVFWESGDGGGHLYLRDVAQRETLRLDTVQEGSGEGTSDPVFQIANAAADRVFFTDKQRLRPGSGGKEEEGTTEDLYECQIVEVGGELKCELTDLTPLGPGEEEADVLGFVLGISSDGRAVYFVAKGALSGAEANEHGEVAVSGQPNLYVREGGQTKLIAVLSPDDGPTWGAHGSLGELTARVSPNGRYLAFQSQRSLTGYDNRDAKSSEPDEEVFLYDSQSGNLTCPSCNPSGARPEGHKPGQHQERAGTGPWPGTWIAATIPGWTSYQNGNPLYQPRYLSNSGRLFFNAFDALAPEDSNGTADVYEYEPSGVGGCNSTDHGYVPSSNACVDLISSGTSPEETGFLDASESGDDVFFLTSSELTAKDVDRIGDVYDARVGGDEASGAQPVQCEGDGCQQPAVPPNDATPGSLTFNGSGNVLECPKGKVKKSGECVTRQSKKKKAHKKVKKHAKKPNTRTAGHVRGSGK